ncbi:NmrA family NAD(P)-binding protein [Taklimakanibacter deserti]|uniref:NmrA family NAD(P)-binding protein n=1 Tax=Taklimakanibacter deserti TaxID=2267839 RepID=UPI0013C4BFB7
MTTVLITGMRGKTGRQVAKILGQQKGITIRGAGRNVAGLDAAGITPLRFDWDDPGTWPEAVAGVTAIYLVKPKTADPARTVAQFLRMAKPIERVVLLSEIDAGRRDEATDERKVERLIEALPTAWTILRPNWFMQNFAEPGFFLEGLRDSGEITLPAGGQKVSFVDTRDIAEVAAAALLSPGHAGKHYTLTGTEALTFAEATQAIGQAAGHAMRHKDPRLEDYLKALAEKGTAQKAIDYYRRIYGCIEQGRAAVISPDVERVSGHTPRGFSAFVDENRALWRKTG